MRFLASLGAFLLAWFLFNLVVDARSAAILACVVAIIVFFGIRTRSDL